MKSDKLTASIALLLMISIAVTLSAAMARPSQTQASKKDALLCNLGRRKMAKQAFGLGEVL